MTLTNQQRSDRCTTALSNYADEDSYTNLVDWLADAMHWCHLNRQNFDDALHTATMHFEAEVNEAKLR